jgi:hypothetical protein
VNHLDALRALLEADRWIERVRAQRDHLPEITQRRAIEEELRTLLVKLKEVQVVADPLQASLDDVHEQARQLQERSAHLERALEASTAGARELVALQHELEQVRSRVATIEERELLLLIELEPLRTTMAEIRAAAQPLAARRGELEGSIAALTQTLDEELEHLTSSRLECASAVEEPWRSRYEATRKRVGGSGAALLDAGRCDGCRIALSPLDLDRMKGLAPGDLFECPECGRFLLA